MSIDSLCYHEAKPRVTAIEKPVTLAMTNADDRNRGYRRRGVLVKPAIQPWNLRRPGAAQESARGRKHF
jgi:hypothetical protein